MVRVLLVEDDVRLAAALTDALQSHGFTVTWVTTAAEAVTADPCDVVLLDLGLPDGDGMDVIRALRARFDTAGVGLIVVTARGLLQYVPPGRAGLFATVALFVVAMIRAGSRLSLRDLGEVFMIAARNTLPVSAACAIAGIIIGVVGLTGLGLVISDVLVTAFAGSLLLTLIMVALASLILGVGLPVTASYVVLIILAGPALEQLGLAVIVTHLIVYWYSQDSNVTPPVALAAFVAAGIAGAKPMRSALSAWIFAKGLYFIPLMMAYSALLLTGPPIQVAIATVTGIVALVAVAVAIEGYLLRPATALERTVLAVAAAMIMVAPEWAGGARALLGVSVGAPVFVWTGTAVCLVLLVLQYLGRERTRPVPEPATV